MKKRVWVVASLLLMAVSMGVLIVLGLREPSAPTVAVDPEAAAPPQVSFAAPVYTSGPLSRLPPDEQRLAQGMIERFGKRLDHPYWRIRAIESLMKILQQKYPNDWQLRLKDLLRLFFPDHADQLQATLDAYTSYNDWLRSAQTERRFNSAEERLRAIRDKRAELFGADARLIWEQEMRQEQVSAALKTLDGSGLPAAAKVDRYLSTLTEAYGPEVLNPEKSHPVQLMESFLRLESVQGELHGQSAEEQRATLRKLRAGLGLKEEAIGRLEALDDTRRQRYAAGESYMSQRAALEKQYQGPALQVQLNALQNRLFGDDEAQFIRNEEAAGYYRYREKQVIGVN